MQVIFIHHSCFLIEVDDKVLIFDYFDGNKVNGYTFTGERLVFDKDHLYPIMLVRGGTQEKLTLGQQYGGVMLDGDPLYGEYLDERIMKLTVAIDGLMRDKDEGHRATAKEMQEIRTALTEKRRTI